MAEVHSFWRSYHCSALLVKHIIIISHISQEGKGFDNNQQMSRPHCGRPRHGPWLTETLALSRDSVSSLDAESAWQRLLRILFSPAPRVFGYLIHTPSFVYFSILSTPFSL